jgi:hypothetical protein
VDPKVIAADRQLSKWPEGLLSMKDGVGGHRG